MPFELHNEMFYSAAYNETTAGGKTDVPLRGNDITDPFYDAGGEEVAGLDELAAIYSNFRVTRCDIKMTITNTDANDMVTFTIYPNLSSTDDPMNSSAPAQPYAKSRVVNSVLPGTIQHSMDTRQLIGLKRNQALDIDYCGLAGSAPSKQWFWHCVFEGTAATPLQVHYVLLMKYYVEWYGLKKQEQS